MRTYCSIGGFHNGGPTHFGKLCLPMPRMRATAPVTWSTNARLLDAGSAPPTAQVELRMGLRVGEFQATKICRIVFLTSMFVNL